MKGFVTMLSVGSYGRFANGCYQIAGIIGIARKNGLEPVFPLWQNKWHRDGGFGDVDIDVYKHFVNPLPSIPDGVQWQDRQIEWGYHDVQLGEGNWNLSGHFQSEKYFSHCFDEIKFYFRMKDEPPLNDYVAVHWRAGDYSDGAGYHPRMTMDYYRPAMALFPGAKFLVFSDDIPAARLMFSGIAVDFAGYDYLNDFKLMKTCRHFIIGNSSYSAMAAVLGEASDKKVICPRPWFGPRYTDIDGEDIYGDNWTVIDWDKVGILYA